MQMEVQDEEDPAAHTAVNEKQLINNGASSHKASNSNTNGLNGPNNFQSQYSFQKAYESAQNVIQKNASNDVSVVDALSVATGSYVGKSKLYRARSAANTKRGGTGKAIFYNNYSHNLEPVQTVDSNIKVYIPKDYFRHTGYLKDDESAAGDAKSRTSIKTRQMPRKPQTPFKERFNEKLEYPNAPS